jgi:protein gp37
MRLAGTRLKHHPSRARLTQMTKGGPVWTGEVRFSEAWLGQPLRWSARKIFVCAHGDLFHPSVPDAWIDRVFAIIALTPRHTYQILTKRPDRMQEYISDPETPRRIDLIALSYVRPDDILLITDIWPFPNVWLGVSIEDQRRAHERIPYLSAAPAAMRFVSCEPMLGPIDLTDFFPGKYPGTERDFRHCRGGFGPALNWVIVGGESGPQARPMHPDWVRSLRDQCGVDHVPFFFKQWGEWAPIVGARDGGFIGEKSEFLTKEWIEERWFDWGRPGWMDFADSIDIEQAVERVGKHFAGHLLDGREHREMPE